MRKPVFGISNQVRHKRSCAETEDGKRLADFYHLYSKKKGLISCAVTGQLSVSLFSHMQKAGFLMTLLIFKLLSFIHNSMLIDNSINLFC